MERTELRLVPKSPESNIEVVTDLSRLHTSRRANSVFRIATPVEIHSLKVENATEYSLLIAHPVRSDDLANILRSS